MAPARQSRLCSLAARPARLPPVLPGSGAGQHGRAERAALSAPVTGNRHRHWQRKASRSVRGGWRVGVFYCSALSRSQRNPDRHVKPRTDNRSLRTGITIRPHATKHAVCRRVRVRVSPAHRLCTTLCPLMTSESPLMCREGGREGGALTHEAGRRRLTASSSSSHESRTYVLRQTGKNAHASFLLPDLSFRNPCQHARRPNNTRVQLTPSQPPSSGNPPCSQSACRSSRGPK